MRSREERDLDARVLALEAALGMAFALIHLRGTSDLGEVRRFHDDVLTRLSTFSVGGPDPAEADLRTAEFSARLEALLREVEGFVELFWPAAADPERRGA